MGFTILPILSLWLLLWATLNPAASFSAAGFSVAHLARATSACTRISTSPTVSSREAVHRDGAGQIPELQNRRNVVSLVATSTIASFVTLIVAPCRSEAAYIDPTTDMPVITDTVYLDITIDPARDNEEPFKGRLVIGLFGELLPRTAQNFRQLCEKNGYKGSSFYRVLSDFTIQGGAIDDPTGQSSSAHVFEPDNFSLRHTKAGLVSTVRHDNSGGADSRFFIQLQDDAAWADDRYAAFGIVLEDGMSAIVKQIEQVPVKRPQNRPTVDVRIIGSGIIGEGS